MSSVAATAQSKYVPDFISNLDKNNNGKPVKSEDKIPTALDKCIADGIIKTGSGVALGSVLSLVLFKRRMWPITLGIGVGMGMALANCQNNLNKD